MLEARERGRRRGRGTGGAAGDGLARSSARPRGIVLGTRPPGRAVRKVLDALLDWKAARPEAIAGSLRAAPPDVLLLDGVPSAAVLAGLTTALGPPGAAERPAVLVRTPLGRPGAAEACLAGPADDVVNASLGAGELRLRLSGALEVRGLVQDLARRSGEVQGLAARLDSLGRRMADELRLASTIQRSLMPPPLAHTRLDVAREFLPYREVGGDFYDVVTLGGNRVGLAIGDVMGKGVPAALLAASLKACLRAHVSGDAPVEQIVARANHVFWEVSPQGLFASLFFGILDFDAGRFRYVNAGHHYPFLMRPGGAAQDLVEGGTLLGLEEHSRYEPGEIGVEPGDALVFYSDGVTDREDRCGEAFGAERLKDAARRSQGDEARIVLYTLLGEVQGWSAGVPATDDMTLVVARMR